MSEQEDRVLRLVGEGTETGADVLNDVRGFISRFCAFPSDHCLTAVTLWAAHTHAIEHFYTTARLALLSPEAASGKTRVLEILDLLVPEPLFTLNASPAAIFRLLANEQITLLFDEVDAIWNKRGRDENHEDLRALLNAGYKRGASIPRCTGPKHEVTRFSVYCAAALAGLGDLPETIMSRSIIIRMRRRAPNEKVEPFRARSQEPLGHALRSRLDVWAKNVGDVLATHLPAMPFNIVDRPSEVWESLVAVADVAGGIWPEKARDACVALCKQAEDRQASLGVRLLADIRILFGDADAMHSATIVDQLVEDHERVEPKLDADAPWPDIYGKPMTQRRLASMLKRYAVRPTKVRVGADVLQGYRRESLHDAWQRYLPSISAEAEQTEQTEQEAVSLPDVPDVPDVRTQKRGSGCERCAGEGCAWCE